MQQFQISRPSKSSDVLSCLSISINTSVNIRIVVLFCFTNTLYIWLDTNSDIKNILVLETFCHPSDRSVPSVPSQTQPMTIQKAPDSCAGWHGVSLPPVWDSGRVVGGLGRATYNQAACVKASAASTRAAAPKQTQAPEVVSSTGDSWWEKLLAC